MLHVVRAVLHQSPFFIRELERRFQRGASLILVLCLIHGLAGWNTAHQCFHGNKVPCTNIRRNKRVEIKSHEIENAFPCKQILGFVL